MKQDWIKGAYIMIAACVLSLLASIYAVGYRNGFSSGEKSYQNDIVQTELAVGNIKPSGKLPDSILRMTNAKD